MSVSTTTTSISYSAGTTVCPIPFPFMNHTDLVVVVNGVTKVINSDYTVAGGGDSTGTVTLLVAATGTGVVISRITPLTQPTDFRSQGQFFPKLHEMALDRLTMMVQEEPAARIAGDAAEEARAIAAEQAETAARVAADAANAAAIVAESSARSSGDSAETARAIAAEQAIVASGQPAALSGTSYVQGPGTVARTLDAWMSDRVNVKNFGAVGNNVADDTLAIQAAIDYALQYGVQAVYLPAGTYKVTNTIHLGYGIGFANVIMEGDGGFGSTSYTRIKATFVDRPIVNMQALRRSGLRDIYIDGPDSAAFTTPWGVSLAYAADKANYVAAGAATYTNSPYCGVCIDGYSGTTPANPYPRPPYPAFYGGSIPAVGSEYGRSTSSDCFVERCWFYRVLIGICVQPNANANGDFMKFKDCCFNICQIGISVAQVNARSTDYSNCNFNVVHTCIDTLTYKIPSTQGNWAGNVSNVHANQVWRLFNVNMDWSVSGAVTNFYCENMGEIGVMSGTKSRVIFSGCSFELWDCKYSGFTPIETYPSIALVCSYAVFDSCSFTGGRIGYTFSGNISPTFRNCYFRPMTYFGDGYYTSAAEKLAAVWFSGIFGALNFILAGPTPPIQKCGVQGASGALDYDSADSNTYSSVHSRMAGYGTAALYISPPALMRGDPGGSSGIPAASRTASGRGFKVTTATTYYEVGDVIVLTSGHKYFYLESITDLGGGNYEHQWNALNLYSLVSGTYTPDPIWQTSNLPYYFPIGIQAVVNAFRFFKTTAGSAAVAYVDETGTGQTPSFTAARKILCAMNNAGILRSPIRPFPSAAVKINSIVGSTLNMSQSASTTAWWLDCAGICLVRLGA